MRLAKVLDGLGERAHADERLEVVRERVVVDTREDLTLEPARPAFVEPKVAPRVVRNEVPRPRVRDLVRDDIRE
uniref:Uncharacterized protein n=1 Tax=Globisporangium ultimum (strain ATCC 200006 / CBS 805.95 / DAOM BR144) TaxID=431595 RepID=K3WKS2_GLOUD